MLGMMPDYARQIALDYLGVNKDSLDRLKADAAACEERHQKAMRDRLAIPCPSYVYCMLAKGEDVFGRPCGPMPVCPISVLVSLRKLKQEAAQLQV